MIYPGTWLVLATLVIILLLLGMGYYWARTHGQFDDVEAAKHAMIESERERDAQAARETREGRSREHGV